MGQGEDLGKTTTVVGRPTIISEVNSPNGSPVRTGRTDAERAAPLSETLDSHCWLLWARTPITRPGRPMAGSSRSPAPSHGLDHAASLSMRYTRVEDLPHLPRG